MIYTLTGITKRSKYIYLHICCTFPDGRLKYLEIRRGRTDKAKLYLICRQISISGTRMVAYYQCLICSCLSKPEMLVASRILWELLVRQLLMVDFRLMQLVIGAEVGNKLKAACFHNHKLRNSLMFLSVGHRVGELSSQLLKLITIEPENRYIVYQCIKIKLYRKQVNKNHCL